MNTDIRNIFIKNIKSHHWKFQLAWFAWIPLGLILVIITESLFSVFNLDSSYAILFAVSIALIQYIKNLERISKQISKYKCPMCNNSYFQYTPTSLRRTYCNSCGDSVSFYD